MNASMFCEGKELNVELSERTRSDGVNYFVLTMVTDKDSFSLFLDDIQAIEMLNKVVTKFVVNR